MLLHTKVLIKPDQDTPSFTELKATFKVEHIIGFEEYLESDSEVPSHQRRHSLIYLSNGNTFPIKESYQQLLNLFYPNPQNTPPPSEEDSTPTV